MEALATPTVCEAMVNLSTYLMSAANPELIRPHPIN
jgi:hypothetical protein